MLIRTARESDAAAIARLSGELGYPSTAEEATARLRRVMARRDEVALVAEIDGAVVGWAHAFGTHRLESNPFAELAGLVTAEGFRGRGIGRALVAEAERWAAAHGYRSLRVRSNVIRTAAHRFYENLGYGRAKTQAVFGRSLPADAPVQEETAPHFAGARAPEEAPRKPVDPGAPHELPPRSVAVIGRVESPVSEPVDENWGDVVARIVLLPEYRAGLRGLEGFSHALVVTYLHGASFDPSRHLVRRPRGLATMPEVGIFAQRAKDRPNPIGITAVRIQEVAADGIVVRGLDAIDGTPILDIKPYYPQYDRVEAPVVPHWVDELMRDYF